MSLLVGTDLEVFFEVALAQNGVNFTLIVANINHFFRSIKSVCFV